MKANLKRREGGNVQETSMRDGAGDQISGYTEPQMFDGEASPENLVWMFLFEVINAQVMTEVGQVRHLQTIYRMREGFEAKCYLIFTRIFKHGQA